MSPPEQSTTAATAANANANANANNPTTNTNTNSNLSSTEINDERIEYYMFDNDKHMFSSQSGKQRTKKEAQLHTNRPDPCGHTRKVFEKIHNSEQKKKLDQQLQKERIRKDSESSNHSEE